MQSKKLLFVLLFISKFTFAAWVNMNTGISDKLNDVRFWSSNGVLAGNKGIYYTTTGGNGAGSWTRFKIITSHSDSVIYNHTQFYAMATSTTNQVYICGKDTVNNQAIILYLDISSLTYSIVYTGTSGSRLNSITFNTANTLLYAVGNNGLVIRSNLTTYTVVNVGTTQTLNSIQVNGTYIAIVGNQVILNCTDSGTLTANIYNYPSLNIKDGYPFASNNISGVGAAVYSFNVPGTYTTNYNYDHIPMNGNNLFYSTSGFYIATDHGIYKTDYYINYAEKQITSGNANINKVWFITNYSATGYAVGDNGLLMSTTNSGNPVKPYAKLYNLIIGCIGASSTLIGNPGSAPSCSWYLNGNFLINGCTATYTFTIAGTYTLSYVVWNSDYIYDTVSQVIAIAIPPAINFATTLSDSILCKKEAVQIGIDSSQSNYNYHLKIFGSTSVYGSVAGTGSAVILHSDSLTQGGNYYINVQSAYSQCYKSFTDTMKIIVEHTKADFHSALINADVNENNRFFQTCGDAQNFLWNFPAGTNTLQSSSAKLSGIQFSNTGPTNIQLICWSNNGCYDSITKPGPMVYHEPIPEDTCWAQMSNGLNPPASFSGNVGIASSTSTRDGYLMAGTAYRELYPSRYANTYGRITTGGGELVKYSRNGVLKWVVINKDTTGSLFVPKINSVYSDDKQNIFITGEIGSGNIYTNDGDSIVPNHYCYLAKLDSTGALIWHITFYDAVPSGNYDITFYHIKTDHSGNIYLTGVCRQGASIDKGGVITPIPVATGSSNYCLMKLDSLGNLIWNASLDLNNTNGANIMSFDVDKNNNVYMTGDCEHTSYFYSANTSTFMTLTEPVGTYGGRMFAAKYDSLGSVIWVMKGTTTNVINGGATGNSIASDANGNSYITGVTDADMSTTLNFEVTDASSVVTTYPNVGVYYLMKVSPNGTVIWVTGSERVINTGASSSKSSLCLHKNIISVVGQLNIYSNNMWSGNLLSTNGSGVYIGDVSGNFFIADYDTTGLIQKVNITGNVISSGAPKEIFRDNHDMYYITGGVSNQGTFTVFNDSIHPFGQYGSYIGKMGLYGCNVNSIVTSANPQKENNGNDISVYPNPVEINLIIDLGKSENSHIQIFNMMGQKVFEHNYSSSMISINKKEFATGNGIYFVQITGANKNMVNRKVVVN